MKESSFKIISISVYMLLMLWLVDFKVLLLFDMKLIIIVLFGTAILTLSVFKRGMEKKEVLAKIRWNAQLTGYISTIMLQLANLSVNNDSDDFMYHILVNCRPLLYALIIIVIIGRVEQSNSVIEEKQLITIEEIFDELELTKREVLVAENILENLSNKEIGEKLYISENTVKKHVQNILKKTEATNKEEFKRFIQSKREVDL